MKRVLVTGGAGFIGSHLSRRLLDLGYAVTIVDDLSKGSRANLPRGADFLQLDLGRPESIAELPPGPYAAVCHLAGQSSGEKSFEDPLHDFDANARSTLLLSTWALDNGVGAFLYASSMGVYGNPAVLPVEETAPLEPTSYYGASKLASERILRIAAAKGLRTCAFRMFNVYGPGQDLADMKQGMVSIYLAFLLRGTPIGVKGSLDRVRDFVYVDDVVEAWRLAIERPIHGEYNLATGKATKVGELVRLLVAAYGAPSDYPVHELPGTPGDQFAVAANVDKLRKALGWSPGISLPEGLDRMARWAKGAPRGP